MKRIARLLVSSTIFLLINPAFAQILSPQENEWRISLFGGMNHVREYGCDCDYETNVNDFPLTPSHNTAGIGLSVGYLFYKGFGFELDARYHLGAAIRLRDPSDGDSIAFDAAKHYTITGNLVYQFLWGAARPYIAIGLGVDVLAGAKDQLLITEFGFPFELKAPEDTSEIVYSAGGGILYDLNRRWGLRADVRLISLPASDDHPAINNINVTAGFTIRF